MITNGITVYCASSTKIDEAYFDVARELGRLIAESRHPLINGGGAIGLMGAVNDGCLDAGGTAIGVIPQFMVDKGWGHRGLSEMIVTDGMHTRKATMASMAQAAIAMPGGVGTFDELFEIITWRQLGLFKGKVVILNTLGYYDLLLRMLDKMITDGFLRGRSEPIWCVASTAEEAVKIAIEQ